MFSNSAQFYDALYSWKDYRSEAGLVRSVVQDAYPAAGTLLDVACGTGAHLAHLAAAFDVAGLDLDPELLAIARERVPEGSFYLGDMTDFGLGRRFDAVICLFSSIGYMPHLEALRQALKSMADHLNPGGVFVLEPWFFPEAFTDGYKDVLVAEEGDITIERTSSTRKEGQISILDFDFKITAGGKVAKTFSERHTMTLFTDDDYKMAMGDAGLELRSWDPNGPTGRGLYVAVSPNN